MDRNPTITNPKVEQIEDQISILNCNKINSQTIMNISSVCKHALGNIHS